MGFEGACGVALGPGGKIYVSDYFHDAVDVFSPEAQFLSQIAAEHPVNGPCGLTVDSAGEIFVNHWRHDVVKHSPATPESLSWSSGSLIDPGPATGVKFDSISSHVYVDDHTYVTEYEPSGAPVEVGGEPIRIGLGTLGEGFGLAVSDYPSTQGDVYVPDAADETVKVYDPSVSLTQPVQVIDGSGTPQVGFTYLGESEAAVDPTDGHVLVIDEVGHDLSEEPEIVVDEFNAAGDYRGQILAPPRVKTEPSPGEFVFHRMTEAEPSAITIGPYGGQADTILLSAGNSEAGAVWIFGPSTIPGRTLKLTKSGTGDGTVTSQPHGINCGTACAAEYNEEERLTLYAIPDAHSDFTGWSVEGPGDEPCPGAGSCSVVMFGNVEVKANFERAPQKTLAVSVSGNGTVRSEPAGISCPGECSEEFAEGHTITLIAKPAPHTRVASWGGCSAQPNITECRVTMSEAKSISVQFAPIPPQTLSVSVAGPGEVLSYPWGITCPSSCSVKFDEGSTVYLVASPPPGWVLGGWQGSGCSGTGLCVVPMREAESVKAEFVSELPNTESPQAERRGTSLLPTPQIALHRVAFKGHIALAATVSNAGRLSILNHWLRPIALEPNAGGVVTLPLKLNASGRAALRRSRHHPLQVKVTVVFMPTYRGTPAEATTRVTVGGNGKHH